MVSGALAFISLFLAWYSVDFGPGLGSEDANALDEGLFPLATYIPLIGLAMGVLVALTAFANVNLPENVFGFTWSQIYVALGVFAALLGLGFLLRDAGGADRGIGLWLGLLASIGLVVGAVMYHLEGDRADAASSAPPTPF
jgi:hypothetical protein